MAKVLKAFVGASYHAVACHVCSLAHTAGAACCLADEALRHFNPKKTQQKTPSTSKIRSNFCSSKVDDCLENNPSLSSWVGLEIFF